MTTFFAQADIGQLQAAFLKQMMIALFAFGVFFSFVVGAVVAVLQYRMEKRSKNGTQKVDIHPQPVEVAKASKRYNHEAVDSRFKTIEQDVERHEEEIAQIRTDQTKISTDIAKQIADLPGKIVVDILNAQKLGRGND